ncbi:uncharacterized protein C8Q71DRAFT_836425 [Rhodofomes roseus]|uniref:F-box domain-containing protein n=1 Tax=Rhodofomes roseus TaxID=34475 RepID=A0ABQ8KE49_9APHY|nr:uncharacterized protein C8Q71DRAFT_836425 [Rhodofomes roseus]KAH9835698.1 hypothetical protein C8Q71DRAFT_836425 [Rhodofomes roseus]
MSGNTIILAELNDDVLGHILQWLPVRALLSLSMSCRWLREACMHLLFGRSSLLVYGPGQVERSEDFLPASLRPYVHSMVFCDECFDQSYCDLDPTTDGGIPLRLDFTDDPMLCGAFPAALLAERLREIPRLRSLTLYKSNTATHGLPWGTLRVILSEPRLRELKLRDFLFCPVLRSGEELDVGFVAPLTTFQYVLYHPRDPWTFPSEMTALAFVLGKLCETLETLILSSEPAPPSTLSRFRWPRLRKLVYYGTPWNSLAKPFVSLCSGMQGLRCLSLKLSPPPDTTPQLLWPPDHTGSFPWPELERLVISYPRADDDIYSHLPSSLRALSLRCWEHVCDQQWSWGYGFTYPPNYDSILRSSTLLSVLRQCKSLNLDHLEIEYIADETDDALLQYIATTFPRLTSLKMHRHRSESEESDISVAHIAHELAPLSHLRRLKMSLDFESTPRPVRAYNQVLHPSAHFINTSMDTIRNAAATIARVLGPSLRVVILWGGRPTWHAFDIVSGRAYE